MPSIKEAIEHLQSHNLDDIVAYSIWQVEDVQRQAKEDAVVISEEEAKEVLERIHRHMDAAVGISWTTISCYLDDMVAEGKARRVNHC
jgi:Co/Zn/Cd efflux system component